MSNSKKFSKSRTFKNGTRLRRRSDNRRWYLFFKNPDGLWKEKSLNTIYETEAVELADKLVNQMKTNHGKLVREKTTLEFLFQEFCLAKEDTLKPESLKRIRSSFHMFSRWLANSDHPFKFLKDLTPRVVREYQRHRLKTVSRRTADNDIKNLGSLMIWGKLEGLVTNNPFDYSRKGTVEISRWREKPKKTFEKYELEKVLEVLKAKETLLYDMALVLSETGMRLGELLHLIPESLDWDKKVPSIIIEARPDWSPKDPREVKRVPMTPKVQGILKERWDSCRDGEYLFQTRVGTKVSACSTRERFKRYIEEAGIELKGRRLHWHSLRNYFVKRAVLRGLPLNIIMSITGHDSYQMALHYSSPEDDEVADQFLKMLADD